MYTISYDPTNRFADSDALNKKTCIKYVTNGFKCPTEQRDVMKNYEYQYYIKEQAET
jgi:epoxyqueuosine reductase QueG